MPRLLQISRCSGSGLSLRRIFKISPPASSFDIIKRERNKAFFQHGSILLNNEILPGNIDKKEVVKSLILGFEKKLKIKTLPGELTKEEINLFKELRENKYKKDKWNYKR